MRDATLHHVSSFATSGQRTLVLAKRALQQEEARALPRVRSHARPAKSRHRNVIWLEGNCVSFLSLPRPRSPSRSLPFSSISHSALPSFHPRRTHTCSTHADRLAQQLLHTAAHARSHKPPQARSCHLCPSRRSVCRARFRVLKLALALALALL
eukprot:864045-Pleurochrysis_carterae.AAC.1